MSERSLRKEAALASPMNPFGIIFGMTVLPRCTSPATVKPLGPTDTNCAMLGNGCDRKGLNLPCQVV